MITAQKLWDTYTHYSLLHNRRRLCVLCYIKDLQREKAALTQPLMLKVLIIITSELLLTAFWPLAWKQMRHITEQILRGTFWVAFKPGKSRRWKMCCGKKQEYSNVIDFNHCGAKYDAMSLQHGRAPVDWKIVFLQQSVSHLAPCPRYHQIYGWTWENNKQLLWLRPRCSIRKWLIVAKMWSFTRPMGLSKIIIVYVKVIKVL